LGSMMNFGGYIGGALAPTVTGFIVQATGSFEPALLVGAAMALMGALSYIFVVRRDPIAATDLDRRLAAVGT
jgi:cyanate permease